MMEVKLLSQVMLLMETIMIYGLLLKVSTRFFSQPRWAKATVGFVGVLVITSPAGQRSAYEAA